VTLSNQRNFGPVSRMTRRKDWSKMSSPAWAKSKRKTLYYDNVSHNLYMCSTSSSNPSHFNISRFFNISRCSVFSSRCVCCCWPWPRESDSRRPRGKAGRNRTSCSPGWKWLATYWRKIAQQGFVLASILVFVFVDLYTEKRKTFSRIRRPEGPANVCVLEVIWPTRTPSS